MVLIYIKEIGENLKKGRGKIKRGLHKIGGVRNLLPTHWKTKINYLCVSSIVKNFTLITA